MTRRANPARCRVCRLHETLCICALVPRLATRTRVVVVMHEAEARKPTNTGSLAVRCLTNGALVALPDRDQPGAPRARALELAPDANAVLLFPALDALPLSRDDGGGARTLVVPDGTWRQARKMRTRVPGLDALPCVTLPTDAGGASAPTQYRLRNEGRPGGLATLEAIARALAILEPGGAAVADAMLAVFRVMVERTLWMRGELRDDEVTGGLPEAALLHDPRGGSAGAGVSATKPRR